MYLNVVKATHPTQLDPERTLRDEHGYVVEEQNLDTLPGVQTIVLPRQKRVVVNERLWPTAKSTVVPGVPGILEDRRCALAHALAHVVLHVVTDGDEVETPDDEPRVCCGGIGALDLWENVPGAVLKIDEQAHHFAAALLMPEGEVGTFWQQRYGRLTWMAADEAEDLARDASHASLVSVAQVDLNDLTDRDAVRVVAASVATRFAVSIDAAVDRLHELKLLGMFRRRDAAVVEYTVRKACGHEVVQTGPWGTIAERERASKDSGRRCKACAQADWDETNKENAEWGRADGLPPLTGTPRAVGWAETIRRNALEGLRAHLRCGAVDLQTLSAADQGRVLDEVERLIRNEHAFTIAKTWIDHRDLLTSWIGPLCVLARSRVLPFDNSMLGLMRTWDRPGSGIPMHLAPNTYRRAPPRQR